MLTKMLRGDLPTKFFDYLVLLPNLRTLEVFSADDYRPPLGGPGHKSTQFPSIRELKVDKSAHEVIRKCPNVESVVVRRTASTGDPPFQNYQNMVWYESPYSGRATTRL